MLTVPVPYRGTPEKLRVRIESIRRKMNHTSIPLIAKHLEEEQMKKLQQRIDAQAITEYDKQLPYNQDLINEISRDRKASEAKERRTIEQSKPKLKKGLTIEDAFHHTLDDVPGKFLEVRTACFFSRLGLKHEHEPKISGKTPDFRIKGPGTDIAVECRYFNEKTRTNDTFQEYHPPDFIRLCREKSNTYREIGLSVLIVAGHREFSHVLPKQIYSISRGITISSGGK